MLTWEDDVEVHALRKRGWTISAIARHTGFDRKTVRKYLAGDGKPGIRARPGPDPFDRFGDYVTARLTEDPHLWARALFDELEDLGFGLSYQSLTRNIRVRRLRPVCEACQSATERPNAVIPHAPGDETQWDWLELPDPPASWGWGKTAHLLVGSLAHSGKWRGSLAPAEDQPHLVAGLDRVSRGLGGLTRVWRFDRMATVCELRAEQETLDRIQRAANLVHEQTSEFVRKAAMQRAEDILRQELVTAMEPEQFDKLMSSLDAADEAPRLAAAARKPAVFTEH